MGSLFKVEYFSVSIIILSIQILTGSYLRFQTDKTSYSWVSVPKFNEITTYSRCFYKNRFACL